MGETGCNIDPSGLVERLFHSFDERTRQKVFKSTLRKAAGILSRQTKKNLVTKLGDAANEANWWNGRKMKDGVIVKVSKSGRSAKVSIMGDFRLKFFELGTVQRCTLGRKKIGHRKTFRRGSNRGSIKPLYFFKSAKSSTEQKVFSSMQILLKKSIERINKKQNG